MFSPHTKVNEDIHWGLGWGLAEAGGRETFWHWGNNGVYRSFCAGDRADGSAIVVLTNSSNGMAACRQLVEAFFGASHPAFAWEMVMNRR